MSDCSFANDGFSVHENVLDDALRARVLAAFESLLAAGAGERAALSHPAITELARSPAVRALVEPVLGADAFAFRATLFDKTEDNNWPVAWHQDRFIPVTERLHAEGYARWSQKPDGWYVEPPLRVQERSMALRVDLDGSGEHNGGLRFVAGSHRAGVLDPDAVRHAVQQAQHNGGEHCPKVVPGGALRMRPLVLHSSRRTVASGHRRIVHFEFAAGDLPHGVQFVQHVGRLAE